MQDKKLSIQPIFIHIIVILLLCIKLVSISYIISKLLFCLYFQSIWLKDQLQQYGSTLQCFRIGSKSVSVTSAVGKLEEDLWVLQVKIFQPNLYRGILNQNTKMNIH